MSAGGELKNLANGREDMVIIDQDKSGLFKYLMLQSSFFYCVGCIICCPCIKCYTDTQQVQLDDKSVTLSYDMGMCGNSTKSVPLDRIQDITVSANCLAKCVGVSNVSIQTAGSGGPQAEIVIFAPRNATMVRDMITSRRDAMVGHARSGVNLGDGTGGITATAESPLMGGVQAEMRDTLGRIESLIKAGVDRLGR